MLSYTPPASPTNSGGLVFSPSCDTTSSSEVRHLPAWVHTRLALLVEDGHWQIVMAAIPRTPPWLPGTPLPSLEEAYHKKYKPQDVRLLELELSSGRGSHSGGISLLLEEWGCSGVVRPTIADLISLLDSHSLHAASAFLRRDVLKESCSDSSTEQFAHLEQLVQQDTVIADVSLDLTVDTLLRDTARLAATNPSLGGVTDTTRFIDDTIAGFPDLDKLMALDSLSGQEDKTLHETPSVQEDEHFLLPDKLSKDANDMNVNNLAVGAVQRTLPFVEFDASVALVPHIPYDVLYNITNGFLDTPFQSGGRKIGEGAFGVVFKAELDFNNVTDESSSIIAENICANGKNSRRSVKELAIKKLNFADERVDKQFKVEVEILSECNHPNILPLEGYSCDGSHWCLLYAFMPNGSLQDRLALIGDVAPLTCAQRVVIAQGSAEGLAYLHTFRDIPMIHRDIKSANILLDVDLRPKIGDFGLVRMGGSGSQTRTLVKTTTVFGTSAYMAPEAFRGDVSVKLDTFSYGVVLLEILTGLPPYDENRDGRDLLSHIEGSDDPPESLCDANAGPWPQHLPKALLELAMLCVEDRKNRPNMVEVTAMWKNIK